MAGLPEGGKIEWPPEAAKTRNQHMAVWKAWYQGDPEMLAAVYGGGSGYTQTAVSERRFEVPRNHPAQYRGGLVGTVARMWWGKPIPPGDYPSKLHVPAASDLAVVSSQLLFSEPPRVRFEDKATQEWWDKAASRSKLHAKLLQAAEIQAPMGGVYMVIAWDQDVADAPFLRPVQPDCALPEWRWDTLEAVTFWQPVYEDKNRNKVWRHLERHERGRILHGLYLGDDRTLGWPVPLQSQPATAMLQPVVETIPKRLTAAYIPNMLPNRDDLASNEGRSDYSAGLITLMDSLDETYTSLMRDLDLGKARLVVPESYLNLNGAGQGSRFETDRAIFTPISTIDSPDRAATIEQVQFAIRVADHLMLGQELHSLIVRSAGYSTQAVMGTDSETQTTATETNVKDRKSWQTRDAKGLYWGDALETLAETLLLLAVQVFGAAVTPERPTTEFGEQVQEEPLVLAQTVQALAAAEAASIETKVRMAHPGWEDKQVNEEVQRLKDEVGTPMLQMAQEAAMPVPQGAPAGLPGTNPTGKPAGTKPTPAGGSSNLK